jgi:hypothetical protein
MKDLSFTLNYTPEQHVLARRAPTHREQPFISGLQGWLQYASNSRMYFGVEIGNDHFLREPWAEWGLALKDLLNGPIGRLDSGTLESIIRDNLEEQGFDVELRKWKGAQP